jgi:hypothetical protein
MVCISAPEILLPGMQPNGLLTAPFRRGEDRRRPPARQRDFLFLTPSSPMLYRLYQGTASQRNRTTISSSLASDPLPCGAPAVKRDCSPVTRITYLFLSQLLPTLRVITIIMALSRPILNDKYAFHSMESDTCHIQS